MGRSMEMKKKRSFEIMKRSFMMGSFMKIKKVFWNYEKVFYDGKVYGNKKRAFEMMKRYFMMMRFMEIKKRSFEMMKRSFMIGRSL